MSINIDNRTVFLGDNLKMLRGINSECIDLVYMDPPFNKKKPFHAPLDKNRKQKVKHFDDMWRTPEPGTAAAKDHQATLDYLAEQDESLLRWLAAVKAADTDHAKQNCNYLTFMAARFVECRRVLKPTGSLLVHCDDTMSHWLKLTLDAVFGERNFVNELVWSYHRFSRRGGAFARMHNIIFFYAKDKGIKKFNKPLTLPRDDAAANYKRGYHVVTDRGVTKLLVYDAVKAAHKIKEAEQKGRAIKYCTVTNPTMGDVWGDISVLNPRSKERRIGPDKKGYSTQKPLALLRRLIEAMTDPGDFVLDPFSGSGTTAAAAETCEGGFRRWAIMDRSVAACEVIKERLPSVFQETPIECVTYSPDRKLTMDESQRWVYVVSDESVKGWLKVGFAKDPDQRLETFRTGRRFRDQINIEHRVRTAKFRELEAYVHKQFERDYEWVKASISEVKAVMKEFL